MPHQRWAGRAGWAWSMGCMGWKPLAGPCLLLMLLWRMPSALAPKLPRDGCRPQVRQAVRQMRDEPRAVEGAPAVPDVMALQASWYNAIARLWSRHLGSSSCSGAWTARKLGPLPLLLRQPLPMSRPCACASAAAEGAVATRGTGCSGQVWHAGGHRPGRPRLRAETKHGFFAKMNRIAQHVAAMPAAIIHPAFEHHDAMLYNATASRTEQSGEQAAWGAGRRAARREGGRG